MRAGRLRHEFAIFAKVENDDDYGGRERADEVRDWIEGDLEVASASEVRQYSRNEQVVTHKITTRWTDTIESSMTLGFGERRFYVITAVNPDSQERDLVIMAREGGPL